MSSSSSSSSRRSDKSKDPQPESPLSDRSPRLRDPISKKKSAAPSAAACLSPKTPLPLPNSREVPKHPRRYSTEKVTDFRLEEVHRPTDRVVHVDLEDIEGNVRGGTPNSSLSIPANGTLLLSDSAVSLRSSSGGPRTSTPRKSSRKSRAAPESLYKKVLKKSTSRSGARQAVPRVADSSMDSYGTAQESMHNRSPSMSPIRIEADASYRSANSTQRALFSQHDAAPLPRRSVSRSRRPAASAPTMCQLVTPLVVHTSQEVNAVSVTGQVLFISQTLVRSAHASSNVRSLMNHLAEGRPLISNEMSQVDIDHDNEHTKHEVFVGSDAILIQRVSTIHRGRDRNSFETDDRRTYRFICQGDLLPEDRRDKQSKPRHLTIIAESTTNKDCEEIEKSERVVLIFDAAEKPARVLAPMPSETSLTHANDLASKPSALKDSPVTFEEHVRVSDHSHINIVRKARVTATARLWDEPLTELKEQRIYKQQLVDATDCEPVRITRSHSMSRVPGRDRSMSASRRVPQSPSRVERGRTSGRSARNGSVLRPLSLSPLANERHRRAIDQLRPDITPSAPLTSDLITCISPIKDEPARREAPSRFVFNLDDTVQDSPSLPIRRSPERKTPIQNITLRVSPSTPAGEITTCTGRTRTPSPATAARSVSRSPAKHLPGRSTYPPTTPRPTPAINGGHSMQSVRSRSTSPATALQRTPGSKIATPIGPVRTARSLSRSPAKHLPGRSSYPPITPHPTPAINGGQSAQSLSSPSPAHQQRRPVTPLRTARVETPRTPTRPSVVIDEDTSAGSSQSPTQKNRTPTTVSPRRARLTTAVYQSPAASSRRRTPSRDSSMDDWERMLDNTQLNSSPVAASIARRIPNDFMPAVAPTSDSRLARRSPPSSATRPSRSLARPSHARPLGPAKSCNNLDSPSLPMAPLQQQMQLLNAGSAGSSRCFPPRRAFSEHSVLQTPPAAAAAVAAQYPLAAPANSAITIASPFRRQQYVQRPAKSCTNLDSPSLPMAPLQQQMQLLNAPQPRLPRTTRPSRAPSADSSSSSGGPISISGSATRRHPAAATATASVPVVRHQEFKIPESVVGTQSNGVQKNVDVVHNPEDYSEGEILKKRLTLDCKINGHLWTLSVTFALKADRADLIRFAPKRVRIDEQTLWEETENWSQTSLTPVTGPRTVARGSTSYDQVQLLQPVQIGTASASTQTPSSMDVQTLVRVASKVPKTSATVSTVTASTASSRSKSTDKSKKAPAKKSGSSSNSKSGEDGGKKKKPSNTPYV